MKNYKRVVDTGFWNDDKVIDFSPEDKYFMLFLLTNEFTNQLGVYYLPLKKAAFDLGYTNDVLKVLLDRFETKYSVIKYSKETSEVAIKNYLLYSVVKGGKPVFDCLCKDAQSVKDKSLLGYVYQNLSDKEIKNDTIKEFVSYLADYKKESNKEKIYINDNDNDNDNERIVDESWTNREKVSKINVFIEFPTNKQGEVFQVTNDYVNEMKELYPFIDVEQEIRSMKAWLINNPAKRKTKRGMTKFIGNWLGRCKNTGITTNNGSDALEDFLK